MSQKVFCNTFFLKVFSLENRHHSLKDTRFALRAPSLICYGLKEYYANIKKRVLITMAVFLMKLAVNNLAVFLIKWQ
jgi:fumarate reductase subunit D